jgi:hypothetical protein
MLSIRSSADMEQALASLMDPALRSLLTARRDQLAGDTGLDLSELVHIIVALPGDTLMAVETEAGVPLATSLVDGSRLGDREFDPCFEYVEQHPGGWWEAVLILSDDGFGIVLLVQDRIDVDPRLPLLLRRGLN